MKAMTLAPRLERHISSSEVWPKVSSLKAQPKVPSFAGKGKMDAMLRSEIAGICFMNPSRGGL